MKVPIICWLRHTLSAVFVARLLGSLSLRFLTKVVADLFRPTTAHTSTNLHVQLAQLWTFFFFSLFP